MSVLPYQEILTMCGLKPDDPDTKETQTGPITPGLKKNIRSAGYDLRLGCKYHLQRNVRGGKLEVEELDATKCTALVVPPNEVVIVTTVESLKLPDDLVGHLTLKLDLLLRGLIMANQSQIDAGYEGGLFILLYNLSDQNVSLQQGDSILRLELVKLTSATSKPYSGAYKSVSLAQVLKSPIGSSLAVMRREVDKSKKDIVLTQVIGAAVVVVTTVLGYFGPLASKMDKLEQQVADVKELHYLEGSLYGSAKKDQLDSLTKEVNELKRQIQEIEKANAKGR
jgi:dCTP deaminase